MCLSSVCDAGLVGQWPFGDYGGTDISGNHNHATLTLTSLMTDGPPGTSHGATYVTGEDYSAIMIPASSSLDVRTGFTLVGKVKPDGVNGWLWAWDHCVAHNWVTHVYLGWTDPVNLYSLVIAVDRVLPGPTLWNNDVAQGVWIDFGVSFDSVAGNLTLRLGDKMVSKMHSLYKNLEVCAQTDAYIGSWMADPDGPRNYAGGVADYCLYDEVLDLYSDDFFEYCKGRTLYV